MELNHQIDIMFCGDRLFPAVSGSGDISLRTIVRRRKLLTESGGVDLSGFDIIQEGCVQYTYKKYSKYQIFSNIDINGYGSATKCDLWIMPIGHWTMSIHAL